MIAAQTLGKAHLRLYYGVEDIMEKYREIQKLENSVKQILDLMNGIELLLKEQGEMLDSIEIEVQTAKKYVGKANNELHKEQKRHKAARKVIIWKNSNYCF